MIVPGWRTALLLVLSLQALILAGALLTAPNNRTANRFLAALMLVIAGMATPYILGFAGFYDAYPWLSFAPFSAPLALGPLLYGYVHGLARGRGPGKSWLHLAPAAAQIVYSGACFALPLAAKVRWNDAVHEPRVEPVVQALVLVSLGAYAWAGLRLLARYRAWLERTRSDADLYAARWMRIVLLALMAMLAGRLAIQLITAFVGPIDYFGSFTFYAGLSAAGVYLGVEGWRYAERRFPAMGNQPAELAASGRDWQALGEAWRATTRAAGWHLQPDLTLADLARRLGLNTSHLSRGINEGLGVNFSEMINTLRAQAAADLLSQAPEADLLQTAFEAGFSSKASFYRAFRAVYGVAPSAWRRRLRS